MKKKIICFDIDNVICRTRKNFYKDSKKVDWECEIGVCLKEDVYQIKQDESETRSVED